MMAMDVNPMRAPPHAAELMTISAGSYAINANANANTNNATNNNNNNNNSTSGVGNSGTAPPSGCCGILGRLFCTSRRNKTANVASDDANNYNFNTLMLTPTGAAQHQSPPAYATLTASAMRCEQQLQRKTQAARRRTPQEVYFESRGKSCKKLLKFNGSSNKILLYPEEGWARTASSSYWTITPCWWQPNRCRIEEFSGTQRQVTRAKMLPLEQKGALLVAGHFRRRSNRNGGGGIVYKSNDKDNTNNDVVVDDEFKLYLTSNISMEDYNMGYCLTGFVERHCQQTNTFQMTHFAVIKRQWPTVHGNGGGGGVSGCRSRSESKST